MAKSDGIDPSVPAGSEDPKQGDNRIRALARAVIEILSKDHYVGSDGGAGTGYNEDAAGEHSKFTLRATTKPVAASGKGFGYAKTEDGKTEFYYEDAAGNEIKFTVDGILNSCNLTGDQTIAGAKTLSSQLVLPEGLTAAKAIISTLAAGTAPLTVASGTKVSNLNADKVDGKHSNEQFGAWASKISNTSYLAASDGFAIGYTASKQSWLKGYTDSSSPPTTVRVGNRSGEGITAGITLPVKKGDYWKITSVGTTTVFWLPIGA